MHNQTIARFFRVWFSAFVVLAPQGWCSPLSGWEVSKQNLYFALLVVYSPGICKGYHEQLCSSFRVDRSEGTKTQKQFSKLAFISMLLKPVQLFLEMRVTISVVV